jgi:hypothetical protein
LNFNKIYVASGETKNLIDSLVGSPLAANTSSPIILTSKNLPPKASTYLQGMMSTTSEIRIFGGNNAVPLTVGTELEELQKKLKSLVVKVQASVKYGTLPIFKQIQLTGVTLEGAAKFRVEGSSTLINIKETAPVVTSKEQLMIYIYSKDGTLLAKGSLDVSAEGDKKSFEVRVVQ